MGHEVEAAVQRQGHTLAAIFDVDTRLTMDALRESGAEVAIDFTQPTAVVTNLQVCGEARIPVVIGTTGWESSIDKVRQIVDETRIGCIMGSNFSIGVNLFLQIVRNAALEVNAAGYDAFLIEEHHRSKIDFPSGTAIRLGEAVLSGMQSKSKIVSELRHNESLPTDALLISSVRSGQITGTHTVGFDSEEDTIELVHRAKSRKGFANGAVRAAEWIAGRKGFYRFEENIQEVLNKRKSSR